MRRSIAVLFALATVSGGCTGAPVNPPGQGGAAGSGASAPCATPADCPAPADECELAVCANGQCGVAPMPAGVPLASQVTGDCRSRQCDGAGAPVDAVDDTDVPIDGKECTYDRCANGVPSNPPRPMGDPCGAGGTMMCDGAGRCVGCTQPSSCGADTECQHPTCTNGVCGVENVPQGTPLAQQVKGDCKRRQCNGAGAEETVADDTDVFDDGNPCTTDECASGAPVNTPVAPGTPCAKGTGKVCDASGTCVQCLAPSDCPGTDSECATRVCNAGVCGVSDTSAGTAVSSQTAGDCKKLVCDGSGAVVTVADDSDLPNDNNPCTADTCSGGAPVFTPVALGTGCGVGLVCNATGHCQECNLPIDCGVDGECRRHTCTAGTCGLAYTTAGTPLAVQILGDCKRNVCDGLGNVVSQVDDTDLPLDDGNQCTGETCSGGVPAHPPLATNTPCQQAGGAFCDGTGSCVACNSPSQCPGADTECQTRTCVAHVCGVAATAAGFVTSAQTPGDCKRNQCNGLGAIVAVTDDTDVPLDDGNQCTAEVCSGGVPLHPPRPLDFPCSQSGGSYCDGAGSCVQCNHGSQCPSFICTVATHACAAASCSDGVQNGGETGVDCGGPCPPCGGAGTFRFAAIGDYGSLGPGLDSVAAMVHGWNPDAIITLGDNVYSTDPNAYDLIDGSHFHDFMSPYTGAYGAGSASGNRFWPILGNHDYDNLPRYLAFYTLPNNEHYYDIELAPGHAVHLFGLSGDPREPDGVTATSVQAAWLQGRLAATTSCFKLVTIHEPPYVSVIGSSPGDDPLTQWPYQAWGADLVMSGDTHGYERLSVNGFPYIVNGLGGGALYGDWTTISPYSVYRFPTTPQRYGVQLITVTVANGIGTLRASFYGVGDVAPEDTLTLTKSCN